MNRMALVSTSLLALLAAPAAEAVAQDKHLTVVHYSPPRAGWAMESIDAYVMTRFGCLETLTKYDGDNRLVPGLAESWSQSGDATWDFKLRQNVKFQDGAPFNADAVVAALNHVLTVPTPSRSLGPKTIAKVEALDASTVRITTPKPSQLLPYRMAAASAGILSPAAYGKTINVFGTCTGPFRFVSEVPKQSLAIVRNDDYWGDKAKLAKVDVRWVIDAGTRVAQLRSGEAELVMEVPVSLAYGLNADKSKVVSAEPIPRIQTMIFNHQRKPFDNPLVRRAIQAALDVTAISEGVYEGYAEPASGPFAPGQPWRPDLKPVAQDLDKAKALLAEAGVDPASVKIDMPVYNDRPDLPDIALVIQQQLQALGLTVNLRVANYAGIEPDLIDGKFDISFLSRNPLTDMADPSAYLASDYGCGGSQNFSKFCDKAFDDALAVASNAVSEQERYAGYEKLGRRLEEEAIAVFVVHPKQIDAHSAKLKNFKTDPLGYKLLTTEMDIE